MTWLKKNGDLLWRGMELLIIALAFILWTMISDLKAQDDQFDRNKLDVRVHQEFKESMQGQLLDIKTQLNRIETKVDNWSNK